MDALLEEMQSTVQKYADQTLRKLHNLTEALGAEIDRSRHLTPGVRAASAELSQTSRLVTSIGNNPRGKPEELIAKFAALDESLRRAARHAGIDYVKL